jgi:general secretion pathway protein D
VERVSRCLGWLMTSALLLSGCTTSLPGNDLLAEKLAPKPSKAAHIAPPSAVLGTDRTVSHFEGAYSTGSDKFVGVGDTRALQDEAGEDITLNLVNVPLPQAAKTVLGEVLELNYSVDGRVNGAVTLQTTKPISRSRLLSAFEAVLRDNGAAMVEQSGVYRIVPAQEAMRTVASLEIDEQEPGRPGLRSHVLSLNYVSASEMAGVLQSIVPEGMILKVDAGRNLLIVSGTDREIANLKERISESENQQCLQMLLGRDWPSMARRQPWANHRLRRMELAPSRPGICRLAPSRGEAVPCGFRGGFQSECFLDPRDVLL